MSQRGSDYHGRGRGGHPQAGHGGYQGGPGGGYGSRGGSPGRERGRGGSPSRGGYGGASRGGNDQLGIYRPGPVSVDSRLQDSSQDKLVAAMNGLSIQPTDLPPKPGYGTFGRPINLRSNFFAVRVEKGSLYEYNVEITPATAIRRVKRRIFQIAEESPSWASYGLMGTVAHDHSAKLISAKRLPQPLTLAIPFYDDDENGPTTKSKTYHLNLTFVQKLDLDELRSYVSGDLRYRNVDVSSKLAALQIILAAHANRPESGGVLVGRNRFFFKTAMEPFSLGGGLEAWKGFYSSVRPAHKQLMINVNVCMTAFYKEGKLSDAIMAFRNSSFGARTSNFVRGLRVKTFPLLYKKTIKTAANVNARQHKFFCDELRKEVTVEEYYYKKYKVQLAHPEMELVDVGGKRSTLIPPEMCLILPNQPFRGKLTDEHTAQMILAAAKPPNVNAASIEGKGLDSLGFRPGASSLLNTFGIAIKNEMTVVPARILEKPRVQYANNTASMDERASWNMRSVKFKFGAKIRNLAVILIKDGNNRDEFSSATDPELIHTIREFLNTCSTSGMGVDKVDPPVVEVRLPPKSHGDPMRSQVIRELDRRVRESLKSPPGIFLVILSNGDKHVYSQIKALFDVRIGVATVCVQSAKIRKERGQTQYFANVALKFNMKLGGVNHTLEAGRMDWIKKEPTMMVGIDVTHPGPGSVSGTPSIAAVVASTDPDFAQFPASLRMQKSKQEMVAELDEMMMERLKLFQARNGFLPTRIIVYRDGVSEGQFSIVIDDELRKIKRSFRRFDSSYAPKLTIVICGKRHHTRFYPTRDEDADSKKNPLPGTVVDRGVTSVYHFDFFLQAHAGLQGSTKPTHYYVVYDDNHFSQDRLQGLTNDVSYLFARATKAVSLVLPAYYADLACERGRCYIHRLLQGMSSSAGSSVSGGDEASVVNEAMALWGGGVKQTLKDTMFYL
ncbi:hypothetical protein CVT24_003887 [Panaeolus cyanescens]|uniref:Piwi domain-containing protein n=1 Tax=Panaeolus cyanescens TaxID=181874 RepID=A0A409VV87_9AGAR|nr:hypothetical protein CVT24_003887 [Panaeolus cyanescens]